MDEKNKKEEVASQQDQGSEPSSEQAALTSEVERLRQELEAKTIEAKQNYDRFLRQVAELENLKKRVAREKEEISRYANETLIRDLLPILDNLERAVDYAKGGGDGKPLLEGVDMVLKGLLDVLGKHGVTQISALGEIFDPEKHEAFAQVETAEREPNSVVEEHHKGYYLFDRLLRPSLVSVAKSPKTNDKEEKEGEVEKGDGDD